MTISRYHGALIAARLRWRDQRSNQRPFLIRHADQPRSASLTAGMRWQRSFTARLMRHLGFDRFAIAGHDRGYYTAFRAAMDFPTTVTHFIALDGVPILEAIGRCDARFARAWWHWFFFAQQEKPERVINADPDAGTAAPSSKWA